MPKGFISVGRGTTVNQTLVKNVYPYQGKFFLEDVYGTRYTITETLYKRARKKLNLD